MRTSATELIESRVGSTIAGKYVLDRLLGAGGMGAVFAARNTWTERRVAVKLMLADAAKDADLAARFLREARAASKIDHPNVVQILDMGQSPDGSLFIVQEFLVGNDLRRMLDERRQLSVQEALELIVPVMSALVVAHKHGIVHRDLKPENIFLAKSSTGALLPKLIDFGIAKVAETADAQRLTRTGATMGTPYYMSPEQASGDKHIDAQTDIWAMGVVLYEMLSGRCPFEADNYNALILQIVNRPVPRIESFAPHVPAVVADVIHRALEHDREKRYRTIAQFLGALLDCQAFATDDWYKTLRNTHQSAAERMSFAPTEVKRDARVSTFDEGQGWVPPSPPHSTTLGRSAREIPTPRPRSGRRSYWLVGGGALLAVGALGTWMVASRNSSIAEHHHSAAPPPIASTTSADAATSGAARQRDENYVVSLSADPPTATIEIDGEQTNASTFARRYPRDGRSHRIRVTAPGYDPREIEFADAPPPPTIQLAAVRSATPTLTTVARRQVTPPPPAPSPSAPAPSVAPPRTPEPAVRANGAPAIGE